MSNSKAYYTPNQNISGYLESTCIELLPCGVCRLTGQVCPKQRWEPSWIQTTTFSCNTKKGK